MFWIRISFLLFISMILSIIIGLMDLSLFGSNEIILFVVCFIIVLLIYITSLLSDLRAGQEQLIHFYQKNQRRMDHDEMEDGNTSNTEGKV